MTSQESETQPLLNDTAPGPSGSNGFTTFPHRSNSNDLTDPLAFDKLNQRLSVSQPNINAPVNSASDLGATSPSSPEEPLTFGGVATLLLSSTFGFKKIPFSFLFIVTYVIIAIIATPVQVFPPPVLQVYPEKYLLSSWTDLQEISKEFHPYSSHANDRVHDYILSQVQDISHHSSDTLLHTKDDARKFIFEESDVFDPSLQGRVVYFEGNNILVKIQGNDSSLGSVLVSAHYDSVPTAYGTTDDGAGIASMLGILRYYADPKTPSPRRSIILNFNNNEEFGLLGAQAFFQHPWSKEAEVFLNLEGTGAGGRAILFRSTDYGVAKHYKAASSPHINSIFQQGFTDGYIRSETDYKVYTSNGLRGLDVAFYKPRNLYHTRRDSIRGTTFGALSHMFTNALDVVRSMASAEKGDFTATSDDTGPAVYFDILGRYAIVVPLQQVFQLQVIGIVAGPILLISLFLIVVKTKSWHIGIRGWLRGIISLVISSAATVAASKWLQSKNELVVISQIFSPLLLLFSIFLLTNYFILGFASYIYPVHDQKLVIFIEIFIALWAILVISTVNISENSATGEYIVPALYFLYLGAITLGFLGLLFTTTDDLTLSKDELSSGVHTHYHDDDEESGPLLQSNGDVGTYGSRNNTTDRDYTNGLESDDYDSEAEEEAAAEAAVENSFKNQGSKRQIGTLNNESNISGSVVNSHEGHGLKDHVSTRAKIQHIASKSLSFDWSLQFLLVVPIGFYLVYSNGLLTFEALRENAQEGASRAAGVYLELSTVAIILGVLVVPFVHRLHALVPLVLLGTVIVCGYRSLCLSPLSHEAPIKMRFIQSINLDDSVPGATVSVLSRQGLGYKVLSDLPSVKRGALPITCRPFGIDDNEVCSYEGPRPWVIDGNTAEEAGNYSNWLDVTVLNTHKDKKKIPSSYSESDIADEGDTDFGPFTGEIFIQAKDSRVCTLQFNTTIYRSGDVFSASPVRTVTVYHDSLSDILKPPGNTSLHRDEANQETTPPPDVLKFYKGINDLTVHKLNWTQEGYHLEFLWIPRWYENNGVMVFDENTKEEEEEKEEDNHENKYKDIPYSNNSSNAYRKSSNYFNIINHRYDDRTSSRERMHMNKGMGDKEQQFMETSFDQDPSTADKRALGIEVTCYWGEYDSESIIGAGSSSKSFKELENEIEEENKGGFRNDDNDPEKKLVRKVPALDEVLQYGPTWVSWTNWAAGIVEVKKYIEL